MRIRIVAASFVREAARSRLFFVATLASALLVVVSFLVGPLSLGTGEKITRDLGLASLVLSAALMIFTGGIQLTCREIERKTIHLVLARPIGRWEYVLGKFLGMLLTAWMILGLSAAVFAVALALRGSAFDAALAQAAFLSGLELVVLSAVAVFFASVAGPIAAMLYALGTFIAGHTMAEILSASAERTTGASRAALEALRWAIPDLSRFDMRLNAVHGVAIGAADLGWAFLYAILYAGAILALACAFFRRRELA